MSIRIFKTGNCLGGGYNFANEDHNTGRRLMLAGVSPSLFFARLFVMHPDFAIIALASQEKNMGKGDKKSKKGKIRKDSYGNSRSRKALKAKLKRSASAKSAAADGADAKPKRTAAKKKAEA